MNTPRVRIKCLLAVVIHCTMSPYHLVSSASLNLPMAHSTTTTTEWLEPESSNNKSQLTSTRQGLSSCILPDLCNAPIHICSLDQDSDKIGKGCISRICHQLWLSKCSKQLTSEANAPENDVTGMAYNVLIKEEPPSVNNNPLIRLLNETNDETPSSSSPPLQEEMKESGGLSFLLIALIIMAAHLPLVAFLYVVYRYKGGRFRQVIYTNPCLVRICYRKK